MASNLRPAVIDLVTYISNEFGSAPSLVLSQVHQAKFEIDGQEYEPENKLYLPVADIQGKEVVVIGPERHWKFTYNED